MDELEDAQRVRALIGECLAGNIDAVRQFQEEYGELIYGYPIRVFRTPAEDAGDFYLFAFDGSRIFRRLRTFEGRAPFRAYLLGFVLDDLILEWKRAERKLDTVSIDEVSEMTLQQAGQNHMSNETNDDPVDRREMSELLAKLDLGKVVVMKLLHAEDYELSAEEIRHVAKSSGRTVPEVVQAIDTLRDTIRDRETVLRSVEDNLESVHAWIQLYQRRQRRIGEDLAAVQPGSAAAARLQHEQDELARKMSRRERQREKLQMQARRRKVTAPYKDIAALLNTTIGNIGSQISRLREELTRLSGGTFDEMGRTKSGEANGAH